MNYHKTIIARRTDRYGNEVLKPVDDTGVKFLAALGKKEFTREIISALQVIGITLEVI